MVFGVVIAMPSYMAVSFFRDSHKRKRGFISLFFKFCLNISIFISIFK